MACTAIDTSNLIRARCGVYMETTLLLAITYVNIHKEFFVGLSIIKQQNFISISVKKDCLDGNCMLNLNL